MANQKHLNYILNNRYEWNQWRNKHPYVKPDLRGANLCKAHLDKVNLSGVKLEGAVLQGADLKGANLNHADLSGADLSNAHLHIARLEYAQLNNTRLFNTDFSSADLTNANFKNAKFRLTNFSGAKLNGAIFGPEANLREVFLSQADLRRVNLYRADLQDADLSGAILVGACLEGANLTNCSIYGIAAWDIQVDEHTVQKNLKITPPDQPAITVDNIKVAQFIYLLLNNAEIRDAIDTIAKKAVLILGRFTDERKAILDALREALRTHGYLPILFDFDKPSSRSFTETVRTLAHLAFFIIADLTDSSSIPQELQAIVPTLAVPVQPVLLEGKSVYAAFVDFPNTYHWVLPIHYYTDQTNLLATLKEQVIKPAEQKAKELEKR